MDLGAYVAERRKKLGLVQSAIAEELHYSIQAISRFEQGQSQLSLAVLPHLADLLQESFDDLLHCLPEPSPLVGTNPEIKEQAFAENLVAARKGKGLSQKGLAIKLGIGERSLQNYEKGNSLPSPDVALAMADYFGLSPKAFFCDSSTQGASVVKLKKGWRFFVLPALVIVVVGGGGVGIACGLGAFGKGAGSETASVMPTSESTPGDSDTTGDSSSTTSATSSPTSSSTTSASSSSDPSSSSSSSSSSAPASSSSSGGTSSSASSSQASDPYPGFTGLKSFSFVSQDGTSLAPGSHILSLVSEPSDYFSGIEASNVFSFTTSHVGVSFTQADSANPYSEITLTIADNVTNNYSLPLQFKSTYNHRYVDTTFSGTVANPNGDLNSDYYAGLKDFTAEISTSSTGPWAQKVTGMPGSYYATFSCSPTDWFTTYKPAAGELVYRFSFYNYTTYPIGFSVSDTESKNPCPFTIPDNAPEGRNYEIKMMFLTMTSPNYSTYPLSAPVNASLTIQYS
jgi:transcriptional regulator with XRE-family HTH domain